MTFRRLSLLLLSLFILSCNNQPEIPENDPAFADYILAHTSGLISAYSEIEIHLAQDLNPGVEPGTPIDAKIFDFGCPKPPKVKPKRDQNPSTLM